MQLQQKYSPRTTIVTIAVMTAASWAGVALLVQGILSLSH